MARGKGKKRGGMSRFAAQSADEIEERNRRLAEFDAQRHTRRAEAGCEDGSDDEKAGGKNDAEEAERQREAMLVGQRVANMTMGDKMEEKEERTEKRRGALDGLIEVSNPNYEPVKTIKLKDLAAKDPSQMTRKEREAAEKEASAAAYRKRHEMGLTEEYKRDMAKLEEVRKRREEAAAKVAAEKAATEALVRIIYLFSCKIASFSKIFA